MNRGRAAVARGREAFISARDRAVDEVPRRVESAVSEIRSDFSDGRNSPTVRLLRVRYFFATATASAGISSEQGLVHVSLRITPRG